MPTLLKNSETGIYYVRFKSANGMITRSTHETDLVTAKRVIAEAKIAEMEMAAKVGALTADALQAIMAGRKVSCIDALEGWAKWRTTDSQPNTIYTQRSVLVQFFNRIGCDTWSVTRLKIEHIDSFVNDDDGTKLTNREMRLASIRSFFKFCAANGYILGNQAMLAKVKLRNLSKDQKEQTKRVPFTEREYRHIMARTVGFWKYATALSYWTGLRLSDICCLEWSSITPNELIVWTQKDEDRVALPLDHKLIGDGDLILVLMEMLVEKRGNSPYVFPEQRREILDPALRSKFSVYYGRILTRLGIEGKSFHCLRHAFATRLEKAGVTIEQIGRLLGHSDEKTTKGYTHNS